MILNPTGRPLEFHCTAPVRPNRAQQILYGSSLRPYLFGEQIGQTLIGKAKIKPLFVCTDVEPAMSLRDLVDFPVVLVRNSSEESAQHSIPCGRVFTLAGAEVAVAAGRELDSQTVVDSWKPHEGNLNLNEPFDRIREAIEEAHAKAAA